MSKCVWCLKGFLPTAIMCRVCNGSGTISWSLWLDDQLDDPDAPKRHTPIGFIGAKSIKEAQALVESNGVPDLIDLDHDLEGDERAIDFLKWLYEKYPDSPPKWKVHSANPAGASNLNSFMDSWHRSLEPDK